MASQSVAHRSADELAGEPLIGLLVESFHAKAQGVLEQAMALARPVTFEAQIQGLSERWFSWTVSPVKRDQAIGEIVIIATDITDLKREADERRQLERRMNRARKMESLGILAGGIAHDFNNLLVGVLGNANLLRKLEHDASARTDLLREIEGAALRATDLCDQMLAYAGLAKIKKSQLNLTRLVDNILPELRARLGSGTEVLLDLDPQTPLFPRRSQPDRARRPQSRDQRRRRRQRRSAAAHRRSRQAQASRNPLPQASPGSIRYLPSGDYVSLEVQDFGKGMGENTLSRIFDPFFSTKFAGPRPWTGSGSGHRQGPWWRHPRPSLCPVTVLASASSSPSRKHRSSSNKVPSSSVSTTPRLCVRSPVA